MYRRYSTQGNMGTGTMSSAYKSLILLTSTAAIRPYIYDWTFGTAGTPSDSVVQLTVTRFNATAATLGTASVVSQLDASDANASTTGVFALTAEEAASTILFQVGLNVRATYRWVAAPGGELIMAASTTTAGSLGLRAQSPAYVLDANATIYLAE
jgi:hypothetical protein